MRVLVDRVRLAVLPVLEELRRGARVVDLVEVHAIRLVRAEPADRGRAHDEEHQDERVEPIDPARSLATRRRVDRPAQRRTA